MKKMHEQQWTQKMNNPWSIRDEETGVERAHVFNDHQTREESDAAGRLIAAAPDMARALLAQGHQTMDGWHTHACIERDHNDTCEAARAALHKAGAL